MFANRETAVDEIRRRMTRRGGNPDSISDDGSERFAHAIVVSGAAFF
jgi:hypothetical protein